MQRVWNNAQFNYSINLQVFSSISFATNVQHSHCVINTLHKVVDDQAAKGDMSEAKAKMYSLLIVATYIAGNANLQKTQISINSLGTTLTKKQQYHVKEENQ